MHTPSELLWNQHRAAWWFACTESNNYTSFSLRHKSMQSISILQMYAKDTKKKAQLVLKSYPKKYSKNLLLPFGLLKKISKPNWNYIDIISVFKLYLHLPTLTPSPCPSPSKFTLCQQWWVEWVWKPFCPSTGLSPLAQWWTLTLTGMVTVTVSEGVNRALWFVYTAPHQNVDL